MTRTRSTIYEVARHSGVSTATVSRAMRGDNGMSAATRDRVLAAAAELGWIPDGGARSLASRRAGVVGVLFHDLDGSGGAETESPLYVDEVIRGAERAATGVGDGVLIAATRGRSGRDLAFSVAGKVDGLVVLARSVSQQDVEALAKILPIVTVGAGPRRSRLDDVSVDNFDAMRAMTHHLLADHGYTDLVFIGGPARSPDSMQRFAGYRAALAAFDHPVPKTPAADGGFTESGGARAISELLDRRRPPRAIVCGNDEMALGVLNVLRSKRIRVPGDVAVTGFDDIAAARHIRPGLTTVRQPMRDLGEQAVRTLLDRIDAPDASRRSVVLTTTPVLRQSCGCPIRSSAGTRSSRGSGMAASDQGKDTL